MKNLVNYIKENQEVIVNEGGKWIGKFDHNQITSDFSKVIAEIQHKLDEFNEVSFQFNKKDFTLSFKKERYLLSSWPDFEGDFLSLRSALTSAWGFSNGIH